MAQTQAAVFDMTAPVPLLWPALLEPKAYEENGKAKGEPKYGGSFPFPGDNPDLKAFKEALVKVAREKWPGVALKDVQWPINSGDDMAAKREARGKDGAVLKGKAVVKARSKYAPMISWAENGKIREVASNAGQAVANSHFYPGVLVLGSFNLQAIEVNGSKIVTVYLQKVFSTGKGERIGGAGRSAAEAFKGYIGHATTEDPRGGAVQEEEIPF